MMLACEYCTLAPYALTDGIVFYYFAHVHHNHLKKIERIIKKMSSNFFVYARKSIHMDKSESIKNQILICKNYIISNYPEVSEDEIKVYTDDGFSGKDTNRPRYELMMQDISKSKNGYLVCYKLDRVSRSISDFSNLINDLSAKKVNFVSVKEQFDTSTICGRTMMYIFALFAQIERETTAERVRDGMMMLAKTGRWLGGVTPAGFDVGKKERNETNDTNKKSSYLKPNDYMETVKLIFEKYLEHGSVCRINKQFFDEGIKTLNGANHSYISVKQILRNPVYCTADAQSYEYFSQKGCKNIFFEKKDFYKKRGLMAYNRHSGSSLNVNPISDWIVALADHDGIIPGKDWVKVQNMLDLKRMPTRKRKHNSLLSGIIYCKNCDVRMNLSLHSKVNEKFKYVCKNKLIHGAKRFNCENVDGNYMDNYVLDYLLKMDLRILKQKIHMKRVNQRANAIDDKIYETKLEISKLKKYKSNLLKHLSNGEIGSTLFEEIESEIKKINRKINTLKSTIENLGSELSANSQNKKNLELVVEALKKLQSRFSELNFDEKKSLVRLIVNKIVWSGDCWNIIFNFE